MFIKTNVAILNREYRHLTLEILSLLWKMAFIQVPNQVAKSEWNYMELPFLLSLPVNHFHTFVNNLNVLYCESAHT